MRTSERNNDVFGKYDKIFFFFIIFIFLFSPNTEIERREGRAAVVKWRAVIVYVNGWRWLINVILHCAEENIRKNSSSSRVYLYPNSADVRAPTLSTQRPFTIRRVLNGAISLVNFSLNDQQKLNTTFESVFVHTFPRMMCSNNNFDFRLGYSVVNGIESRTWTIEFDWVKPFLIN
jgi:hypothetical protein